MNEVFLKIFNMSMTAVLLIVAVILLRLLFKKAPKWISCLLWALVAVRLICPITFESPMSVLPTAEPVKTSIVTASPYVESGVTIVDSVANDILRRGNVNDPSSYSHTQDPANPAKDTATPKTVIVTFNVAATVWIIGVMGFLIYGVVSYVRLRKTVAASVRLSDRVMLCDEIDQPFILGVVKPVIYLPSDLDGKSQEYVLEHEKAHLARHDHWWKPLGFALLAVHWFNPLCWVAYILFGRDIELACDEKAVRDMDKTDKVGYMQTLLRMSVPGKLISACPVAFAEIGVKQRVKSILSYKKPAVWLIATGVVCCAAVTGCFLTNPTQKEAVISNSDVKIRESETEAEDKQTEEKQTDESGPVEITNDDSGKAVKFVTADGGVYSLSFKDEEIQPGNTLSVTLDNGRVVVIKLLDENGSGDYTRQIETALKSLDAQNSSDGKTYTLEFSGEIADKEKLIDQVEMIVKSMPLQDEDSDKNVITYDVIFEGDIDGDGTKDKVLLDKYDEYGAGAWYLELNGEDIDSGKFDMDTDVKFLSTGDINGDGKDEIIMFLEPHTNSLPYMKYLVLEKNGSVWKELQNSAEFGMTDDNGNPNNSFPVKVTVGDDRKTGIITIDGTDQKITFDLEKHYKKLYKQEKGNDLGDISKGYLDGTKYNSGDVIGGPADWGIWDIKLVVDKDNDYQLIARQGLCGKEGGKFDMYGTIDIYFGYDDNGKIVVDKAVFNENK